METERSVLLEISRIDWDAHKYWVPSLVVSGQSERGGVLCTTPVGNPLPLASCFSEHAMLYCTELLLQLTSIVSNCHENGIHHIDICPQNIVLLTEPLNDFMFPVCLINWGGASFMQKRDDEFHYHSAFSPDWLDAVASLADLSDGERLQICFQQVILTTMYIAFGDVISWLPPMAIVLDEKKNLQQDSHTRVRTKDDLFKIRREIIAHLLDVSLDTPVLNGLGPLRLFFQQLRDAALTLFDLEERCSADNAMTVRIREFCAAVRGRQFAELPAQ
eukprot:ANDGO_06862.mRNA.1 hypothetical protein